MAPMRPELDIAALSFPDNARVATRQRRSACVCGSAGEADASTKVIGAKRSFMFIAFPPDPRLWHGSLQSLILRSLDFRFPLLPKRRHAFGKILRLKSFGLGLGLHVQIAREGIG